MDQSVVWVGKKPCFIMHFQLLPTESSSVKRRQHFFEFFNSIKHSANFQWKRVGWKEIQTGMGFDFKQKFQVCCSESLWHKKAVLVKQKLPLEYKLELVKHKLA